jgi:hypothetical protein
MTRGRIIGEPEPRLAPSALATRSYGEETKQSHYVEVNSIFKINIRDLGVRDP